MQEKTVYFREPDLTVGDFDDKVVTLNLALVGVLDRIYGQLNSRYLGGLVSRMASRMDRMGGHTNSGLFMERSIEDLLWGYDEPILYTISRFTSMGTTFGLMKNGTDANDASSNHFSMINTGLFDVDQIGQVSMHAPIPNKIAA